MKREDLFESIDPPEGGVMRLRARLDADVDVVSRRRARVAAVAAVVAIAAAVALLVTRPRAPDLALAAQQRGFASEAALGLGRATSTAALGEGAQDTTALREVASANPRVSFYWVSSTAWERAEE